MNERLEERVSRFLAAHQTCVIATGGVDGVAALAVPYRAHGLEVECVLPLMAEAAYRLELEPRLVLVIPPQAGADPVWLQGHGTGEPVESPDWAALLRRLPVHVAPADLYRVVRVRFQRVDLIDEGRGWGARETLESLDE